MYSALSSEEQKDKSVIDLIRVDLRSSGFKKVGSGREKFW